MGKKLTFLIALIVLTFACALWSPWYYWQFSLADLIGVERPPEFARLQVTSIAGEVEIFVDDESRGTVGPEGSPFVIEDVKPGKRLIRLERISDSPGVYIEFERLIEFYPELDTVIAYELGPSTEFSEGHLISAFENVVNRERTKLNVYTEQEGVTVSLDGREIGTTPINSIELDTSTVHRLSLEKRGYETLEISLLPEDDEQRERLKGFDINVEANLFLLPLRVE
jgi:hypothetical protein